MSSENPNWRRKVSLTLVSLTKSFRSYARKAAYESMVLLPAQCRREEALGAYSAVFERLHLDGLVYPATQMPPPDETMPQDGQLSGGPHSDTGWVNMIGMPAVVVVGGFYPSGLPFGLEISAEPWKDGSLIGYAFAYEQATHHRRPPVLVEKGLLPNAH